MKTDSLSYRLFREWPESFFSLVGRPATDAARYRFDAIELKDTAVRIDVVYAPSPADDAEPVFFVEFQTYKSEWTYSNVLLKVGLYLHKVNPRQSWRAVVVYPNRSVEQDNLDPYRVWLESEHMQRIYLNELSAKQHPARIGINILQMMVATPDQALHTAIQLVPEIRASQESVAGKQKVIDFIETVIMYQFPNLSRKELEQMLQVNDFRETKVYQEALEEGLEQGTSKTLEAVARRLLAKKHSIEEIAEITGLAPSAIKKLQKKPRK